MRRVILTIGIILFAVSVSWASPDSPPSYLLQSDRLSDHDQNQQSIDLLKSALTGVSDSKAQAAIYWRLARDTFGLADVGGIRTGSDQEFLGLYEQSESYADRAIALDPQGGRGYYWKAACVGKIAQIKNLLRAFISAGTVRELLFTAARLDPEDGEIWYVLAEIYSQIPGFPISFGNTAYAVSLGRKGLEARKQQVARGRELSVPEDYYLQLAKELVRRGWSESERRQRQSEEAKSFASNPDPVEKFFYYEGVVSIPPLSDREEAIQIDRGVVSRLSALKSLTPSQQNYLRIATQDLKAWSR
jgi:tetratricopeptide (TPR) repeat protein